jgi:phosphoglucosamine mutase
MTKRKYFGTDGIRGAVGTRPITPDFMLHLGWAAGRVMVKKGRGKFIIGKDTRISGYMFESALEAGLVAAGVDVALLGPMPTPGIAYLTRTFHASAGIVISASHNPFSDNGIKFFSAGGTKLPDEIELAIEEMLEHEIVTVDSADLGKVVRMEDAAGRYIEYCKSTVPGQFNLDGMRIVVDCANGATYHIAPSVFRELGAEVISVAVAPDGLNINHKVGSTRPENLIDEVQRHRADLGVALDGDGDRVILVDHMGEVIDGDELLYIIASDRLRSKGECSGVVGTLMSNFGFERALKELQIPFVRAQVGDRYVIAEMARLGWRLGGESSGHIICGDVTTTGDGIVAALQVLFASVAQGQSVHELKKGMEKYPQKMVNVPARNSGKLKDNAEIARAVADAEAQLAHTGRVLLRPSGTEPVVRVMVEGERADQVEQLVGQLAAVVADALA